MSEEPKQKSEAVPAASKPKAKQPTAEKPSVQPEATKSDSAKSDSEHVAWERPERRENKGGIRSGGRRKVDRTPQPTSRSAKIWFGLSLLLTMGIMIWTFTLPFRSEKPMFAWDKSDLPQREAQFDQEILDHPEHGMAADDYRAYVMQMEDNLKAELEKTRQTPENLPDLEDAKAHQARVVSGLKHVVKELEAMEAHDDGFAKNSVEEQALENARRKLSETES